MLVFRAQLERVASVVLVAIVGAACADQPNEQATGTEDAAPVVELSGAEAAFATATDLGIRNARHPMDDVVTAGQPTEEQMVALVESGVRHAISLRPASEDGAGWEEAHAEGAGYDFARLPISGAESLTRETVEEFAALLDEAGGEPTLLYCASSNRVGALVALKAAWIDGADPQDALEQGLSAGLTRLEAPVRGLLGID